MRLGYEYLVITDHSAGRGIAKGLNEERLRSQIVEIRRLNASLNGIRLLCGSEVDIKADGSLDAPETLLNELDIVVGAVHSAMGQSSDKMTKRVISAIRNPSLDIIAHPTCRLIGEREPIAIDLEAVFIEAVRYGKALEISAMSTRLDLNDVHARRAQDLGVKLVINTDSHKADHLAMMRFGVGVARRAWCEPRHILNTLPLKDLLAAMSGSQEGLPS